MIPPVGLPVSAPVRVRDRLRAAPDGPVRVLHRGRLALYVEVAGHCVGVLARDAAAVPCGLRTTLESFTPPGPERAYLRDGVLHLDRRPLVVGRVVDVLVAPLPTRGLRSADSATEVVIPPAAVVGFVAETGLSGSLPPDALARHLPTLVGRGPGLTPLGDDMVCGWLVAHRAAGVPTPAVDRAVRGLLPRTTSLSGELLDCALHGEALPQLAAYLAALGTTGAAAAATALLAVGHTSGAGLLHGARLALAALDHPIGAVA